MMSNYRRLFPRHASHHRCAAVAFGWLSSRKVSHPLRGSVPLNICRSLSFFGELRFVKSPVIRPISGCLTTGPYRPQDLKRLPFDVDATDGELTEMTEMTCRFLAHFLRVFRSRFDDEEKAIEAPAESERHATIRNGKTRASTFSGFARNEKCKTASRGALAGDGSSTARGSIPLRDSPHTRGQ